MNDTRELAGEVAIVTGGSKGIGRAVAELALRRGASVVIVGRDQSALDEAAASLSAHGRVMTIAGDVSVADTARRAVAAAVEQLGSLDILANVAGAFPTALLEDTTDAQYAESIATNLTGTFMMCRAALPVMRQREHGAIVNISSTAARFPTPGLSVYSAAKAGIEALTRAVAAVTRARPLGRMAEPSELAEAGLFLASGRAAAITGQVLHANSGGYMA